ncbi:hypothetical protein ABG79_00913 [Caloramator mitchellensis]|uniref:Uncharacterized protein n=1 Tax=Caloramator mitchellensis TaxID=908809 RepID=A0A0R3JU94_CALMK|nr:hypothetical protein [Caloramator mitchellensis]KRQ87115.1 hypothetical protein ABG79_00913 [Caloramator mitchellensis]
MIKLLAIFITLIISASSFSTLAWTSLTNLNSSSNSVLNNSAFEKELVDLSNSIENENILSIKRAKVAEAINLDKNKSKIDNTKVASAKVVAPEKNIASTKKIIAKPAKKEASSKSTRISATSTKTVRTSNSTKSKSSTKLVASRSSNGYGELLDWWSSVSNIFAIGSTARVIDLQTKKSFYVVRTYGHNHADVEAKTLNDTNTIKEIWGGWSWERRPVIVEVNGRRIAASMTAMPHAGVDSAPALKVVDNRSGGYGTGQNLDKIKGNGMDGHIDIHFLNSTRHKDGAVDKEHQAMVKKAAGF